MIPSDVRGKTNSPGNASWGHISLPGVVDIPGHSALLSGLLWSSSWLAFWALYIPFVWRHLRRVSSFTAGPRSCPLAHALLTLSWFTFVHTFSSLLTCALAGTVSSREDLAGGCRDGLVWKISVYLFFTLVFDMLDFTSHIHVICYFEWSSFSLLCFFLLLWSFFSSQCWSHSIQCLPSYHDFDVFYHPQITGGAV